MAHGEGGENGGAQKGRGAVANCILGGYKKSSYPVFLSIFLSLTPFLSAVLPFDLPSFLYKPRPLGRGLCSGRVPADPSFSYKVPRADCHFADRRLPALKFPRVNPHLLNSYLFRNYCAIINLQIVAPFDLRFDILNTAPYFNITG